MSYEIELEAIDQTPAHRQVKYPDGHWTRVWRDAGTALIHLRHFDEGGFLVSETTTDDREVARAVLVHLEIANDECDCAHD